MNVTIVLDSYDGKMIIQCLNAWFDQVNGCNRHKAMDNSNCIIILSVLDEVIADFGKVELSLLGTAKLTTSVRNWHVVNMALDILRNELKAEKELRYFPNFAMALMGERIRILRGYIDATVSLVEGVKEVGHE